MQQSSSVVKITKHEGYTFLWIDGKILAWGADYYEYLIEKEGRLPC